MNIEAIIFDKDGTLIDFDAFWVTVSINAIQDILKNFGREDISVQEILSLLGVRDGVTDIDGVLCKGTYKQMSEIIGGVLKGKNCDVSALGLEKLVLDAYNKNSVIGEIKPTCSDLKDVLIYLKNKGVKLGVVTTDNELITRQCLGKLGVEELFDKIYTDDGKTPTKPNPYCALEFCERFGLVKEQVAMVGDTLTDMSFARNAGIKAIGVAKNLRNKEILAPFADVVLSSLSDLPSILK